MTPVLYGASACSAAAAAACLSVELSSEGSGAASGEQPDHLLDGARGLDGLRGASARCRPL